MGCSRCHTEVPPASHYCYRCGGDVMGSDATRRRSYAARPDQAVTTFAPVGTIMPKGIVGHPSTYQFVLVAALLIMVVSAALGAAPLALSVAAFAVPLVYIVYLYDVNMWEDEPVPVVMLAFVLTFLLGAGWTVLSVMLRGNQGIVTPTLEGSVLDIPGLLITVLLVPVVGEVIRQIGPIVLASRPAFDDLMDGFTFGVIAGVAYASAETVVLYWSMLQIGFAGPNGVDSLQMIALLVLHGFCKPIVYGTASGVAGAEFSGLGAGYDGFTSRYARGVGIAIAAVAVFSLGTFLASHVANPATGLVLALLVGGAVLFGLTLLARNALHTGLMEAALEAAAREGGIGAEGELQFCAACEMPLLYQASFCSSCGLGVGAVQGTAETPAPEKVTVEETSAPQDGPTGEQEQS
ncbi:hypothetical protein HMPREF1531_00276 [Propionibacterium sp. oral taxon 192 str. F0372]|nr:hypothetical protein HMPREF1531_00276 [Propionibacterium sp. oral taxon 192 str. F0372]